MAEKGLGKGPGAGLGALFGTDALDSVDPMSVPISKVEPRQEQPRYNFNEIALQELSESIKQYGIIQPITVRKLESGYYQIIAGERRWRAARMAGLTEVPVRVIDADDRRATELALVENLQREDLNPIEEAKGLKTLIDEYGMTQEEAAQSVGKSRPAVANALRLLNLSENIQKKLEDRDLSPGHARALLQISDEEYKQRAAEEIVKRSLSVRQAEQLAAKMSRMLLMEEKAHVSAQDNFVDYYAEVEKSLTGILGRKVKMEPSKKGGRMVLEYYNRDDMEELISIMENYGKYFSGKRH